MGERARADPSVELEGARRTGRARGLVELVGAAGNGLTTTHCASRRVSGALVEMW